MKMRENNPYENKRISDGRAPVALVTGGSGGLGMRIIAALSRRGYRIAANYLTADRITPAMKDGAAGFLAVRADVGNPDQVREMAALIREKFGRLDCIVNNAGVASNKLLVRQSESEWDAVLRTNLKGCFNVIQAMAPIMIQAGGGHIINISSYSGVKGKRGQPAYSASKAALVGLTCSAAAELAEHNIRVNVLLPGYMPTPMGMTAPDAMESARKDSVMKRLSDPAEAAEFICYLLGTSNISGQIFSLDSRIL
jgi:3-oxoacyl-[acyl-carrier protein] reductase